MLERIVYILTPDSAGLACVVRLTKLMKWDAFSHADYSHLDVLFQTRFSAYLRPEDRVILLSLIQLQKRPGEPARLDGAEGREVFNRMLATGRLFFAHGRHFRLKSGPAEPAGLAWEQRPDQRWQPRLRLRPGAQAFALIPPICVDPEACTCGELTHPAPAGLLAQWLAASALDENAAAQFCLQLLTRFPGTPFPTPPCVRLHETAATHPVAVMALAESAMLSREDRRSPWADLRERLRLRLWFRYGEGTVAWDAADTTVSYRQGERVVRITRHAEDERRILEQLRAWGLTEDTTSTPAGFFNFDSASFRLAAPACWREILGATFPALDSGRWQVRPARGLEVRIARVSVETMAPRETKAVGLRRMRLIPLFLLATTIAAADSRSDLENTLKTLSGLDPICARIDFELSNWAGDAKDAPVEVGKVSARIEATDEGLNIHWSRRLLDEATSQKPEDTKAAEATRRAMAALSVPQLMAYLNAAQDIVEVIDGAEITAEEDVAWNGRLARLLTLKLHPKLDEKSRKYIKQFEATARIWLGPDGIPLAAERSHRIKGRAMLVIGFEAEEAETFEFVRTGDRLVVTRHSKEGSGSGAGESNRQKSTAVLTIATPPS